MSRCRVVLVSCVCFWFTNVEARAEDLHSERKDEASPAASPLRSRAEAPRASTTPAEPESPPAYQAAADLGLAEFERGNYVEARARFAEAHRLWPNARSLRALGYCEYELKNYVSSLDLLQQALVSTVRPLHEAQRAETSELMGRARGYVARYTLNIVPRAARLTIDGVVPVLDAERALTLPVGTSVLEVQAPGYQTARIPLQVEGNLDRVILVELEPTQSVAENGQRDEPLRKKWWLWTSVGVVVVAGITGGLIAGLRDPGTLQPSGGTAMTNLGANPSKGEP